MVRDEVREMIEDRLEGPKDHGKDLVFYSEGGKNFVQNNGMVCYNRISWLFIKRLKKDKGRNSVCVCVCVCVCVYTHTHTLH